MEVNAAINFAASPCCSGWITNNNGDVIKFEADGDERNENLPTDSNVNFFKVKFTIKPKNVNNVEKNEYTQIIKIKNISLHGTNDLYIISAIIHTIYNIRPDVLSNENLKINIFNKNRNTRENNLYICKNMRDMDFVIPEEGQNIQNIGSVKSADNNIVSNVNNIINDNNINYNLENGNNNINHNIGGQMQGEDNNNIFAACWNNCTAGLQSLLDKIKSLCID